MAVRSGIIKKGTDQQFAKFETYCGKKRRKVLVPDYTIANSVLHFKEGGDVRIKLTVKYEDYKQFKSNRRSHSREVAQPKQQPEQ